MNQYQKCIGVTKFLHDLSANATGNTILHCTSLSAGHRQCRKSKFAFVDCFKKSNSLCTYGRCKCRILYIAAGIDCSVRAQQCCTHPITGIGCICRRTCLASSIRLLFLSMYFPFLHRAGKAHARADICYIQPFGDSCCNICRTLACSQCRRCNLCAINQ